MKGLFEGPGLEPENKKAKTFKGMVHPRKPAFKRATLVSSLKQHVKE
jgi:hypothetical protein